MKLGSGTVALLLSLKISNIMAKCLNSDWPPRSVASDRDLHSLQGSTLGLSQITVLC